RMALPSHLLELAHGEPVAPGAGPVVGGPGVENEAAALAENVGWRRGRYTGCRCSWSCFPWIPANAMLLLG
ncbi:hypothetical protein, partial [Proteus mirabilis]|uniref:hypothetical protein n=1 Tax=Proteus mirabilis TaxID=584 RepID=UPI0013D49E93